jgi:hypothetical protein
MTTSQPLVWIFFYGIIMNPALMKDFGATTNEGVPAKLAGFMRSRSGDYGRRIPF